MLIVHKLLDASSGKGDCILQVEKSIEADVKENFIECIKEAEKFDFGELYLERHTEKNMYILPDLTLDEKNFWIEGLIPLPAPVCWYEYTLGKVRVGLLVLEETRTDDGRKIWVVQRVDYQNSVFSFDGVLLGCYREQLDPTAESWGILIGGNNRVRGLLKESRTDPAIKEVLMSLSADMMLSVYLTLMINSKSTEVNLVPAPIKLNKARIARKQVPLFEHRVVRIIPAKWMKQARGEATSTHSSPRLHWRRSHGRVLHRDKENERRIVIPRFLVGKADLGTITHEYKVEGKNDEK